MSRAPQVSLLVLHGSIGGVLEPGCSRCEGTGRRLAVVLQSPASSRRHIAYNGRSLPSLYRGVHWQKHRDARPAHGPHGAFARQRPANQTPKFQHFHERCLS